MQGNFSTETGVLKCIPSNFFLEVCRIFRTTAEKLVLENVSAYQTADKVSSLFFLCVFCVLYKS